MKDATDVASAISFQFHDRGLDGSKIDVSENGDGTVTVTDRTSGFTVRDTPSQSLVDAVVERVLPKPTAKYDPVADGKRRAAKQKPNPIAFT